MVYVRFEHYSIDPLNVSLFPRPRLCRLWMQGGGGQCLNVPAGTPPPTNVSSRLAPEPQTSVGRAVS